jgi:hypothetical protein
MATDPIAKEVYTHELVHNCDLRFRAIRCGETILFEIAVPGVAGTAGSVFGLTRRFALELAEWIEREFDCPFDGPAG